MKKLMIAAAAAAMIGGAYAIPSTGEQAYNMNLTVKTTVAAKGTFKDALGNCEFDTENPPVAYRKQASKKLAGFIWGCWCETLDEPSQSDLSGFVFWNVSEKFQYDFATAFDWTNGFDWDSKIDRINKDGKKSEGIWCLDLLKDNATEYKLTGAGFGTAAGSIVSETRSMIYVPSMSGYFVGTRTYSCTESGHCGEGDQEGVASWPLCLCGESATKTVAYGSWKIKFNNSAATKYANTGVIQQSYKFPSYVTDFGQGDAE